MVRKKLVVEPGSVNESGEVQGFDASGALIYIESSIFKVRIQLIEKMLGTTPADPEKYKEWIERFKPIEINEDESANVADQKLDALQRELAGWTTFLRDDKGIFLYDYQIKGFFKDAGNTMKEQLGVTALKKKMTYFVFPEPRKIYLGKDKPDGMMERPMRGQTKQGEQTFLVRSDYINEGTIIDFNVRVLKGPVTERHIRTVLEYGKYYGLLRWRNGGWGRFAVLEFERIDPR